jgi:SAM-dependent methyltransferase
MHGISDATVKALIQWSLDTGGDKGFHITRYSMYNALRNCLAEHDSPDKTALAISLSRPFGQDILGLRRTRFTDANYPECNMMDLPFEDSSFDFCMSDQVLEHVEGDPVIAFRESARVVRPGGFICHTTCFINEVHGVPKDFWRFTPEALGLMARLSGCKIVIAAGWGNREAWGIMRHGFRFTGIPNDTKHPLHVVATRNETDVPIAVWVVAEKLPPGAEPTLN